MKSDHKEKQGGGQIEAHPQNASEAEMMAVANSLYVAIADGMVTEGNRVVFGMDNQWCIHVLKGVAEPKPGVAAAVQFIRDAKQRLKLDLRFRKVKAHNPNGDGRCRVNEIADKWAKKGMLVGRSLREKPKKKEQPTGKPSFNQFMRRKICEEQPSSLETSLSTAATS